MANSIEVKVLNRSCGAGDVYAAEQMKDKPKTAIVSCEGACLKGEIARRAANIVAHELAPEKVARICHGGAFMLDRGGMRELVEEAERAIVVEGCPMACGTRIAKAAFPDKEFEVVVANSLYEGDDSLFGVNELPDEEIDAMARKVALEIVGNISKQASKGCADTTFGEVIECSG
jgi:uncharacterized metal-binding protein